MIGIIGAMDIEVNALKNAVTSKNIKTISGIEFVSGKIGQKEVVIAKAGVGKVNAAICAQTMILTFSPDMIINTGVAGSLSSEVSLGDLVIAMSTVQHDMDTSPLGDPAGFISGLDMVYLPCDKNIIELLERCAKELTDISFKKGIIATGDVFLNSDRQKKHISSTFNAIAGEMEGGSIGHVCTLNSIPYCVVRAISDNADGSSHVDYPTFLNKAAANSSALMFKFIERI